jgi:3-deoxy-manno-octulosonate cytidylyltransferase (CMP-KDO synthetase)
VRILGVIPARFASTRFPGKPLIPLLGKPLLQWTIEGARQSSSLQEIIVATDDERIQKLAIGCGARVVMTDSALPSGTDRVFAAIRDLDCDVAVNIQGDEPLVTGALIDRLAEVFNDPTVDMATLAHPLAEADLTNPNAVKVVLNMNQEALYFSRFGIPYSRCTAAQVGTDGSLRHIGMYAYTKTFLKKFCEASPALIEQAESLEQLRALYLGAKIKVLQVAEAGIGVDTPEDIVQVEKLLRLRTEHGR